MRKEEGTIGKDGRRGGRTWKRAEQEGADGSALDLRKRVERWKGEEEKRSGGENQQKWKRGRRSSDGVWN